MGREGTFRIIKIGSDTVSLFTSNDEFIGYKAPNRYHFYLDIIEWYSFDHMRLLEVSEHYRNLMKMDAEEDLYLTIIKKS